MSFTIPPLPKASEIHLTFTSYKMEKAIQCLQHGRLSDHIGLEGEHHIYVVSTISPILAFMSKRALARTTPPHPHTRTIHIILPINKKGKPLWLGNYQTTMIYHTDQNLWSGSWSRTYTELEAFWAPCRASLLYHWPHSYTTLLGGPSKAADSITILMFCRVQQGLSYSTKGMWPTSPYTSKITSKIRLAIYELYEQV